MRCTLADIETGPGKLLVVTLIYRFDFRGFLRNVYYNLLSTQIKILENAISTINEIKNQINYYIKGANDFHMDFLNSRDRVL